MWHGSELIRKSPSTMLGLFSLLRYAPISSRQQGLYYSDTVIVTVIFVEGIRIENVNFLTFHSF